MTEGTHSRFAPSSADRWSVCQASLLPVPQEHGIAETREREDAALGSAMHALGAACLNERRRAEEFLLDDRLFHGRHVTVDMIDNVNVYLDFVRREFIEQGYEWFVEHRVEAPGIHEDCYGTADFRAFHAARKHLVIVDYKSGFSYYDPRTKQLAIYAYGELETQLDMGYDVETISVFIVQPLHGDNAIRQHNYTPRTLTAVARELRKATTGNAIRAGDHCEYCPHAHYCETLALYANEVLPNELHGPEDFDRVVPHLAPDMVAEILDRQKAVGVWFAAVARWAAQLIRLGEEVGDWELRSGEGKRRYIDETNAERVLHAQFGDDIYEPRALRSPAQIEKIWPEAKSLMKGRPGVPGLTARPRTGETLRKKGEKDE